ncbi:MAG: hypothetical protein ACT4P4_24320 [Betaproteobacteria bacterium]
MGTRKTKPLLVRFKDRDTPFHVTRSTVGRLAKVLGLSETDVIHKALADYAQRHLPAYEPDNGPLAEEQHDAIDAMTESTRRAYRETDSLFSASPERGEKNDGKGVRPAPRAR